MKYERHLHYELQIERCARVYLSYEGKNER
ncbi:hypothetical protein D041_0429A, partial [Vibrio parahaemolyticus EKP-008]